MNSIKQYLLLIIAFFALQQTNCQTVHHAIWVSACENDGFFLSCDKNEVLEITSAVYGRKSNNICGYSNQYLDTYCQENVKHVIANHCNNKTDCSLEASNTFLATDPCPGTPKYLEVRSVCKTIIPFRQIINVPQTLTIPGLGFQFGITLG